MPRYKKDVLKAIISKRKKEECLARLFLLNYDAECQIICICLKTR